MMSSARLIHGQQLGLTTACVGHTDPTRGVHWVHWKLQEQRKGGRMSCIHVTRHKKCAAGATGYRVWSSQQRSRL